MYDSRAESYAEMQKPMYATRIPRFVEACSGNGALVDVGCGTGDSLVLVHNKFPDIPLIGTEISAKMAEIAGKAVPFATITLSGENLELEKNCARGILCYFVIQFLNSEQLAAAVSSWQNALQPGGRLLIAFWIGESGTAMEFGGQWSQVRGAYSSRSDVERVLCSSGFNIISSEEEEESSMGMEMGFVEASKK
jgi:ubiquinone/menaquinone biosynthesis C-methylase UbiE